MMHKSREWKSGWVSVMVHLRKLPYNLERQIYTEGIWYEAQKLCLFKLDNDWVKGTMAAVELFEHTGYLPDDLLREESESDEKF